MWVFGLVGYGFGMCLKESCFLRNRISFLVWHRKWIPRGSDGLCAVMSVGTLAEFFFWKISVYFKAAY